MSKLRVANRFFLQKSAPLSSRCLSTEPTSETPASNRKSREKQLFLKLLPLARRNISEAEIGQVFTEWNKPPSRFEIINCVMSFRNKNHFPFALKLMRWMEWNIAGAKNSDCAIVIDLLCKTEGIESAEKYFDELRQSEKTDKTYGALFSCYCRETKIDKALDIFEKTKELGFATTLTYNNFMRLFLKIDRPHMVAALVDDMKHANVSLNVYTYNMLIDSYAALKDLDAMENILEMMNSKKIRLDSFTYGNLANIYIDSGLPDKASTIVKDMESRKCKDNEAAFQIMIDINARLKNLSSIYTAWESLKSSYPIPSNKSYFIMLSALFKMGESESLEKYFKEWEAGCSSYDLRLSNILLESYLNRGMIKEANMLNERAQKRGRFPNLKACELFSNFHLKMGEINLALKYLDMGAKIAVPEKHKWYPTDETIKMFLEYFGKGNDTENAKIFVECLKRFDHLDSAIYKSLVGTDVASM